MTEISVTKIVLDFEKSSNDLGLI